MKEITRKIGKEIDYISLADPKFKTNRVEVMFLLPAGRENNASCTLAASMITSSCAAYPSMMEITRRLGSLYGANLASSVGKRGDVLSVSVSFSIIDSRYALEGEDLTQEMIRFLLECLFAPHVRDGAFQEPEFHVRRQDLLDAIQAEINEKRSYAISKASEAAFEGEPFAYPLYGKPEDVEALTPESTYAAYRKLLREAVIRVYHAGPALLPELGDALEKAFSDIERNPSSVAMRSPSRCRNAVQHVSDPMNVSQSKMVMVFKGEEKKKGAMRLFSMLFGAAPFSLLFMNVREKLSLCYYCASRVIPGKDALMVDSGVELANTQKAYAAIHEQLDAVCKGDFTEDMLRDAKHSIVNQLRGTGDTTGSCISWSHAQFCDGDAETVEEAVARYEALTKEDVVEMARSLREDTVYIMEQEVQHEQRD